MGGVSPLPYEAAAAEEILIGESMKETYRRKSGRSSSEGRHAAQQEWLQGAVGQGIGKTIHPGVKVGDCVVV